MSVFAVDSNMNSVRAGLAARIQAWHQEYEVVIENPIEYAAAVDQGSTRVIPATASVEDREAATKRRHAKYGKPKWDGDSRFSVTRSEGETKVIIPPEGILLKSRPEIKEHGRQVLSSQPGLEDSQLDRAMKQDIANGAIGILVNYTPVDEGALWQGWRARSV